MSEDQSKICPYCSENIQRAAKVCPFCNQWLSVFSLRNPATFSLSLLLVVLVLVVGMLCWLNQLFDRGKDFTPYKDSISVVQSSMSFQTNDNSQKVNVVLLLTNKSDFPWKNIEVELRYFNRHGELIDARTDWSRGIIYPHSDSAWNIKNISSRASSDYDSYQVFIRHAADGKSHF